MDALERLTADRRPRRVLREQPEATTAPGIKIRQELLEQMVLASRS
ncbi:hypothetical protein [Frateuria defendens]|nr:hypothetical protein [Frateuria defendens]